MTQVGGMPRPSGGEGQTLWASLADQLRAHPNEAILITEFTDTPRLRSLMTSINQGYVNVLADMPGTVKAHMRGSYIDRAGIRRGDLWVIWHTEN